jgi:hypothetical protein
MSLTGNVQSAGIHCATSNKTSAWSAHLRTPRQGLNINLNYDRTRDMWDFIFGVIAGGILGIITGCVLMLYIVTTEKASHWDNES